MFRASLILASVLLCASVTGIAPPGHAQSVLKDHDTYQPIDITADRLELKQRESRADFTGNVRVIQGQLTMTAENLTVFYETVEGTSDPEIRRLDVTGGVRLASRTETVEGEWGVYDVDRRLVTIGGNVLMTQNDTTIRGDRLELDLVSGLTKLDSVEDAEEGRVRGRFGIPARTGEKDSTDGPGR